MIVSISFFRSNQPRRSGLSRSPEKRCSEVDHAATRVGEEVAAAAGVKVRSVTGKSALPRRSGRHGNSRRPGRPARRSKRRWGGAAGPLSLLLMREDRRYPPPPPRTDAG